MRREILRGKTKEVVQTKVKEYARKGWNPVCEIKEDPGSYDLEFVCVVQNDNIISRPVKSWGSKYHMD